VQQLIEENLHATSRVLMGVHLRSIVLLDYFSRKLQIKLCGRCPSTMNLHLSVTDKYIEG
jgi:hypothetical protein